MCKTIHRLYSAFTGHNPERNMQCKELLYTFSPWPRRTWQYYHFNDHRVKKIAKNKKAQLHLTLPRGWYTYNIVQGRVVFNSKPSSCCNSWKGWICQFSTPPCSWSCSLAVWPPSPRAGGFRTAHR